MQMLQCIDALNVHKNSLHAIKWLQKLKRAQKAKASVLNNLLVATFDYFGKFEKKLNL